MRISIFVGARPNFVKAAPLLRAAEARDHECFLIHTGQHYDYSLNTSFFEDLCIKIPDYNFNIVTSNDYGSYMSKMIQSAAAVSKELSPDFSIVVGDTDSSLAAAVGANVCTPLVHVEAGLRSRNIAMREEYNRVLIDNISDVRFCTEKSAITNLEKEGLSGILVGNVMIDSVAFMLGNGGGERAENTEYAVLTIHRAEKSEGDLVALADNIKRIANFTVILFPMHPRLASYAGVFKHKNIKILSPLRYAEFVHFIKNAKCVFTDSGGIQEETSFLGVPCFTLRDETERPITVELGTNTIIGKTGTGYFSVSDKYKTGRSIPFWDGKASDRIIEYLERCSK